MRFSAAPIGRLTDRTQPWAVFGDRPGDPDGLEGNALAGVNLAHIAGSPGAPMFEPESIFGAHMAGQDVNLDGEGPVVVFVHGFGYEPRRPVRARVKSDNAHRTLFHFTEVEGGPGSAEERTRHVTPWFARGMLPEGIGDAAACGGVAVGFSYASYGGHSGVVRPGWGGRIRARLGVSSKCTQPPASYAAAYRDAEIAGYGLAAVLTQLRAKFDREDVSDKQIDIICHSLGARTVMSALALIAQRWPLDETLSRIGRVIILGGACYTGQAAFTLANLSFAAPPELPHIYNVTSRSDTMLRYLATFATLEDALREAEEDLSLDDAQRAKLSTGATIGLAGKPPPQLYSSITGEYPNWVDIPLDSVQTRRWGREYGFDLRSQFRSAWGDHAAYWTHPGNWDLYRAILHERDGWSALEVEEDMAAI